METSSFSQLNGMGVPQSLVQVYDHKVHKVDPSLATVATKKRDAGLNLELIMRLPFLVSQ